MCNGQKRPRIEWCRVLMEKGKLFKDVLGNGRYDVGGATSTRDANIPSSARQRREDFKTFSVCNFAHMDHRRQSQTDAASYAITSY